MKYILLLLISFSFSFALDISIKIAKEDSQNYSILHLKNSEEFSCKSTFDTYDTVTSVICLFEKKPEQRLKPIKNSFFNVYSKVRNKKFFIIIKPYKKMKLFPMIFDFTKKEDTFTSNVHFAKHWMLIGYESTIPYLYANKKTVSSLNLPVSISSDAMPYVGALDIYSKPVNISNVQDVSDYLELKNLYSIKKYEQVLELCNEIIKDYKDSIFLSDVIIYKIRALHQLEESEEVMALSKKFMREYSSNTSMPEILAYTARAYSKIGLYIDADYFFDRLFDEHSDSKFSKLGLIYKGEQLDDAGNAQKAISYYKKALYTTKDLEIAAYAAFKIAAYEVDHKRAKSAAEYVRKIAEKKGLYFYEHKKESIDMAETMFDLEEYESTYIIIKNLLANMKKSDDDYERLLKEIIVALAKSNQVDAALDYIEMYNKSFKDGEYSEEVAVAKDSLFFDKKDLNVSAKLAEYDSLIAKYPSEKIGDKALYKKAKLLYADKRYKEVLDLNQSLSTLESAQYNDVDTMLKESANKLLIEQLDKDECALAIQTYSKYKLFSVDDIRMYTCAKNLSQYQLAKNIASSYLHVKDLKSRLDWLYRYIIALYNLRQYSELLLASDDLIALDNSVNSMIYRYRFDAYKSMANNSALIKTIATIESIYGLDAKDIERFVYMVIIAQKNADDVMVENYARKVMKIQKRADINSQTPFVEFSLIQSLQRLNKNSEAISILKELVRKKLSPSNSARAYYLLGTLYVKENKNTEAKKAFDASIKQDTNSAWSKLAKDALLLL